MIDVDPCVEEFDAVGHNTQTLAPETLENAPAGHGTHVFTLLAPDTDEYVPTEHPVHAVAPASEYEPAEQVIHVVVPASEYDPAEQVIHTLVPVTPEYDPAGQLTHALAPASEYDPAGHVWQVDAAVAAAVFEYVPSPHGVHVALPPPILYWPATQAEHGPPSGPVYPALQVHAVTAELPLGDIVLAEQLKQLVSDVAPLVSKYLPAPQLVHAALPLVFLYVPAEHTVQS